MKEVTMFYTNEIKCYCPYCNSLVDGWYGDPRGEVTTCDFCDKEFKIGEDIDIEQL